MDFCLFIYYYFVIRKHKNFCFFYLMLLVMDFVEKSARFRVLFDRCFPRVKGFAFQLLKSDEDAEDIAQEVFIRLWERPELWVEKELLDSYLYTMARNGVFNFIRHQSVVQSFVDESIAVATLEDYGLASTEDECELRELELLIQFTIEQMPEKRREVFKLSREEELSNQEIADRLNLSVRTVEQHIYKALQDLKRVVLLVVFLYQVGDI